MTSSATASAPHYDLARFGSVLSEPDADRCRLDGAERQGERGRSPSGRVTVDDAAGETIVNVKVGVRAPSERFGDLFVGYGRALTGDRWYEDTVRVEWRLAF